MTSVLAVPSSTSHSCPMRRFLKQVLPMRGGPIVVHLVIFRVTLAWLRTTLEYCSSNLRNSLPTQKESGKAEIAVMAITSNTHCAQREDLECSHIKPTLCTEGGSRVQSHQTHTVHTLCTHTTRSDHKSQMETSIAQLHQTWKQNSLQESISATLPH